MFSHYRKIRNTKHYDLLRLGKLLESSTSTLKTSLVNILKIKNFMTCDFEEFIPLNTSVSKVFTTWDSEYEQFSYFFVEQHKRRGQLSSAETSFTTPLQFLKVS